MRKKTRKEQGKTADGELFDEAKKYWFYDVQMKQVRTTISLRSDGEYLCSFGLRVVPIWKLRAKKADAVRDGRSVLRDEIKEIRSVMDVLG